MGYTKRRLLNHGAVRSIKKWSAESESLFKEREQRIERRENKRTMQMLIKEYEASSALVEESFNPASGELKEIEASVELCEQSLSSFSKEGDGKDEIERLKSKLEFIRGENNELKTAKRKLETQLNALSDKIKKESKINDLNMDYLKTRLTIVSCSQVVFRPVY